MYGTAKEKSHANDGFPDAQMVLNSCCLLMDKLKEWIIFRYSTQIKAWVNEWIHSGVWFSKDKTTMNNTVTDNSNKNQNFSLKIK